MENAILDNEEEAESTPELDKVRFAGFAVRLGASLLDSLVLLPLVGLDYYNMINLKNLSLAMLLSLLSAIYKPLMEYYYGATAGKMMVKIKVVNYQLQPIAPQQALIRYIPWMLSVAVNFLATIALFQTAGFAEAVDMVSYTDLAASSPYQKWIQFSIWVMPISALGLLFNPYKQAVHDQLAKTYCIYAD